MITNQGRQHSAIEVLQRVRARPSWLLQDLPPAWEEFGDPSEYWRGLTLWYRLRQKGYTMLGCRRGRYLHRLAHLADRREVDGDLVDCGVWNGGSTVLLAQGARGRKVWAFDSFEGLPPPSAMDGDRSAGWTGLCDGSVENVEEAFRRYSDPRNLQIVKGWFQETFPQTGPQINSVAVLHADGDWYESILLTLRVFYPKVSKGGFVIVDDYGHWEGARQATDQFRREEKVMDTLNSIDGNAVYWRRG